MKILRLFTACCMLYLLMGCDDNKDIEPATSAAYGGGTLTEYKTYDIESQPGQSIYGKAVFWNSPQGYTLVQISLNNTVAGAQYPAAIYTDAIGSGTIAQQLYTIDGAKGEFAVHKFYAINNADFFDNLPDYNAHIVIMSQAGDQVIAAGNIGSNIGG